MPRSWRAFSVSRGCIWKHHLFSDWLSQVQCEAGFVYLVWWVASWSALFLYLYLRLVWFNLYLRVFGNIYPNNPRGRKSHNQCPSLIYKSVMLVSGERCRCGMWVTPAFQIQNNKVDLVRNLNTMPSRSSTQRLVRVHHDAASTSTAVTSDVVSGTWRRFLSCTAVHPSVTWRQNLSYFLGYVVKRKSPTHTSTTVMYMYVVFAIVMSKMC